MRKRLTLWRRRWCLWRRHPMAEWSPVVRYIPPRYQMTEDRAPNGGRKVVMVTDELEVRQWRCARHDRDER